MHLGSESSKEEKLIAYCRPRTAQRDFRSHFQYAHTGAHNGLLAHKKRALGSRMRRALACTPSAT